MSDKPHQFSRERPLYAAAIWGVFGFALLIIQAIWRLTPIAIEPLEQGTLSWWQGAAYIGWVVFMLYSEGYKGFHKAFSPRMAARAMHLARRPSPRLVALAPLFCMGLVHATRKRLIVSWSILCAIVGLVLGVRFLGQPWRGIVDGGVVVGLAAGLVSVLWFFARGLAGHELPVPADLPETGPSPE